MKARSSPVLVNEAGEEIPLIHEFIILGRAPDCNLIIADRRVSRRHAEICRQEEGFILRDLDSTNGTWLNGRRLNAPVLLYDGDVIEIGAARLIFHDPDATLETSHFPRLVVDEATGDIWVDRRPVQLSPKQYALLSLLWARRGRVCSKDEIARAVWPECQGEIYDYQIESLVKRLRAKLEPDPARPTLLVTVRGRGYRLVA